MNYWIFRLIFSPICLYICLPLRFSSLRCFLVSKRKNNLYLKKTFAAALVDNMWFSLRTKIRKSFFSKDERKFSAQNTRRGGKNIKIVDAKRFGEHVRRQIWQLTNEYETRQ